MTKFRIGRHINVTFGFITSPEYARELGCNIMQIFLGAPQQVISKPRTEKELVGISKELKRNKMKLIIHGSYTINLCHPKKSKLFHTSVKSLIQDLNAAHVIGKRCLGVVIHMGKNVPGNKISNDQAILNYIIGLKEALAATAIDTTIILETGASQGNEVASRLEGLNQIYWGLNDEERSRITFCIDTCHIWATGYDISTPAGVKQFFDDFDKRIGMNKISCIHFNDSKTPINSHVDRHGDLGYGFIKTPGLKAVARFAYKHHIPIIMETPLDAVNPATNQDVTFQEEQAKIESWISAKN